MNKAVSRFWVWIKRGLSQEKSRDRFLRGVLLYTPLILLVGVPTGWISQPYFLYSLIGFIFLIIILWTIDLPIKEGGRKMKAIFVSNLIGSSLLTGVSSYVWFFDVNGWWLFGAGIGCTWLVMTIMKRAEYLDQLHEINTKEV